MAGETHPHPSGSEFGTLPEPDPAALRLLTRLQAGRLACVPIRRYGKRLLAAVASPDMENIRTIESLTGCDVQTVTMPIQAVRRLIDRYYGPGNSLPVLASPPRVEDQTSETAALIQIQTLILRRAAEMEASDIHLEPRERTTRVRFRIDGLMSEIMELPRWLHDSLVTRIKVLAGMDVRQRQLPQDGIVAGMADGANGVSGGVGGHIGGGVGDGGNHAGQDSVPKQEMRISTLPTSWGERVAIHLHAQTGSIRTISQLGLNGAEERFRALIHRPQGMLLVVGPTGSGKTTTLYAIINELRSKPLSIVTIEDPIAAAIDGISQVQVQANAGLTFPAALTSAIRQDPDVILVGEIGDAETAGIAFRAALSGHLVLSTLHATDTVSTVLRLAELGIDRYLISSAMIGVVAQRLIRLNCPACQEPDAPRSFLLDRLHIEAHQRLNLQRSRGCAACNFTGSVGRKPVFEMLEVTGKIRDRIVSGNEAELREAAHESGTIPLLAQALEKLSAGEISVEEAYRTCYFGEPLL